MKRLALPLIVAALIATVTTSLRAETRTWTSADGKKTFDGELVSVEGDKITVKRADGSVFSFAPAIVSEADRKFVAENKDKLKPSTKPASAPAAGSGGNKVAAELQRSLSRGTASSGAKYYVLYFAAST